MRARYTLLLLVMLAFSMTAGCASKYGTPQTKVNYYPACYDPIKKLRDSEYSTAEGTATGAALGVAGGALLGFLATGKVEGALVGGVAGGVAGGVIGNQIAKNQQIADDNKRMAAYMEDLNGSITDLDIASASARASLQCYDKQFKLLLAGIRQKKVSKAKAEQMFAEIESGTREASSILGTLEDDAADMARQYQAALASERQNMQKKGSSVRARKDLNRAQKRCDALQQNVQKVNAQKAAADEQVQQQKAELYAALDSATI